TPPFLPSCLLSLPCTSVSPSARASTTCGSLFSSNGNELTAELGRSDVEKLNSNLPEGKTCGEKDSHPALGRTSPSRTSYTSFSLETKPSNLDFLVLAAGRRSTLT